MSFNCVTKPYVNRAYFQYQVQQPQQQVQPNYNPPIQSYGQPHQSCTSSCLPPISLYNDVHRIQYRPEEVELLNNGMTDYDLLEYLLKKQDYNRFSELDPNLERRNALKEYINDESIKNLAKTKYFSTVNGFDKLLDIIYEKHQNKQNAINKINTPGYYSTTIPDMTQIAAGHDIHYDIKMLDIFFNSTLSEDLKMHVLKSRDDLDRIEYVYDDLKHYDKNYPNVKHLVRPVLYYF